MACEKMSQCEQCKKKRNTVEERKFRLCHPSATISCCFQCANIPTCPCKGSKKYHASDKNVSVDECAFCMDQVYQATKLYDFYCGDPKCRRPLCENCASERPCPVCEITGLPKGEKKKPYKDKEYAKKLQLQ